MRISKILIGIFFLAGLVLLGTMVWQVGLTDLLASFRAVGPWLLPFILLESIPMVLHTMAWAACFASGQLAVGFWRLCLVRLAGSTINQVTPTATIGGEIVKVLLLTPSLPREQAAASVVIDKASYTLAQTCYVALGLLYATSHLALPAELQISLACTIVLLFLGLGGFIAFQRYGLLSKCLLWLGRFNVARQRLARLHQHLVPLEAGLAAYYTAHPWRFVVSLLLHGFGFALGSVQTFLLLKLLLGPEAPGMAEALTVTVVAGTLDQALFFVPGGLGTMEGIRFTALAMLGVAHVYGLTFGLIIRLQSLFWNGLGLLAYAWCTRPPQSAVPESMMPRPASVPIRPRPPGLASD